MLLDETARLLLEENEDLQRQLEAALAELKLWRSGAKSLAAAALEEQLN